MNRVLGYFNFLLARWVKMKYKRFKRKPLHVAYNMVGYNNW